MNIYMLALKNMGKLVIILNKTEFFYCSQSTIGAWHTVAAGYWVKELGKQNLFGNYVSVICCLYS